MHNQGIRLLPFIPHISQIAPQLAESGNISVLAFCSLRGRETCVKHTVPGDGIESGGRYLLTHSNIFRTCPLFQ